MIYIPCELMADFHLMLVNIDYDDDVDDALDALLYEVIDDETDAEQQRRDKAWVF